MHPSFEKEPFPFDEIADIPCFYTIPLKVETVINRFPEVIPNIRKAVHKEELFQLQSLQEWVSYS
jgi:hypothetical protein